MNVCLVTRAENNAAARLERRENELERAADGLAAEYMAAACVPLMSTVHAPTDRMPQRRLPFLDVFADGLTWSKNRHLMANAVSILRRSTEGLALLEELSRQHGAEYADEACE